jgi:hypothetical protein
VAEPEDLASLRAELRALHAQCSEALERVRVLEVENAELRGRTHRLGRLLPAIASALDDKIFTVNELLESYREQHAEIKQALVAARIHNGRSLAKAFSDSNGVPVNGLSIRKAEEFGRSSEGFCWRVCVADHSTYTSRPTTELECGDDDAL